MFYEEKPILNMLKCSFCKEPFIDIIKCLPCGQSICVDCSSQLQVNNYREFKCKQCNLTHKMPKRGLPNLSQFMKLLEIKSKPVSRGPKAEELRQFIFLLNNEKSEFKYVFNNKEKAIRTYCDSLRYEVTVNHESAVEHLNTLLKEKIKQIDDYEQELLDFNSNKTKQNEENESKETITNEIDSFTREWQNYLEQVSLDEKEILKANEKAAKLKEKLEECQRDFSDFVFKNNYLKFNENETFHKSNGHLGNLRSYSSFLKSK